MNRVLTSARYQAFPDLKPETCNTYLIIVSPLFYYIKNISSIDMAKIFSYACSNSAIIIYFEA
ncbi:MAG: hypothetical protein BGP14_06830 [Sphingobacteriales bacterium 44-15]|nr:MAG: hypothetical protein BGP14_06830 [Sphingobacteriales bacterium 44-15]